MKPPLLRRNELTGRIYIITRYHTLSNGTHFVADEKHDVTDQYNALRDSERSEP